MENGGGWDGTSLEQQEEQQEEQQACSRDVGGGDGNANTRMGM